MQKTEDKYELEMRSMFHSPSADGSFEILQAVAGNNLLSEWDNKPRTSTAEPLRDFQSEKKMSAVTTILNFRFSLSIRYYAIEEHFVLCTLFMVLQLQLCQPRRCYISYLFRKHHSFDQPPIGSPLSAT